MTRLQYLDNIRIHIDGLNETATDASITAMHNIYLDSVDQMFLLFEELQMQTLAAVTYDLVDGAYVPDPIKQALFGAKVEARNALWSYANFTDDFIALVAVFDNFWAACDYYVAEIDAATVIGDVDALKNNGINTMKSIEILEPTWVADYKSLVLSVIDDEFMSIPAPTEAQTTIHTNAVNDVNALTHPYDMQMAYDQYLDDLAA